MATKPKKIAKSANEEKLLVNQYRKEMKELLTNINARAAMTGLYANVDGQSNADTLHNIYCDFGYPSNLTFAHYYGMYERFGPATASVDMMVDLSWLTTPVIESKNANFKKSIDELIKKTKLWNRAAGLDKKQRVGRYAGMFIQVKDGKDLDTPMMPVSSIEAIVNLKPIYEGQLIVQGTVQDKKSDDFGQPTMYHYNSSEAGDRNVEEMISANIHPSRLIVQAEGADDGSIYGVPVLKAIFNDLMNLQKISGASGEGFYQNTRNAPVIKVDKDAKQPDPDQKKELEENIEAFLGKWQKKFMAKGLDFVYPNIKLDNPKEHADNCWQNISAGIGISTSEMRGTQTGKLAGDKDNLSTKMKIKSRRETFLNCLIRDVVDWFILYRAIPKAEYQVVWDDILATSDTEKVAIADKMADINSKSNSARAGLVFDTDEIRKAAGHEPYVGTIEQMPEELPGLSNDFINNLKKKDNAKDKTKMKDDPTKTVAIRNRWAGQFSVRYKKLKGRINKILLKGDPGDIDPQINPLTLNAFEFTNDAQSIAQFMKWLDAQVEDLIYTDNANPANIWQNEYIDDSYLRGIKLTDAEIKKLGITQDMIDQARAAEIVGTATPSLASGVGTGLGTATMPIHLDALQLLYLREYGALKGVTDEMSKQIRRVLVEGVEQGLGVRELAKNINNRVDKIGLTRSNLIARTESVRAYNIAAINEGEALAKELGVKPMYRWKDSDDFRVRETHEDRNGNIYTAEEAMKLIGEPNCRCSLQLVFLDDDGKVI